jgi:Mg-chelatase subunit ChlD
MRKPRSNAGHRGRTIILAAVIALCAFAAHPVAAENIDLVVMVDTSESMFPYFDDLMNYLVQDLLTAKLHRGDTFHLLSFSSVPEVEISLEVNSEEAAQRAIGRILLLHALGRYTDLVSALQFLHKYTKELPETNPKQIILITDGVNDPPPDSPNRGSPEKVRAAVLEAAQAMKKEGWTFNILKVPPVPAPGEEGVKSYLPDLSEALGVPIVPYKVADKEHVTGRTTGDRKSVV